MKALELTLAAAAALILIFSSQLVGWATRVVAMSTWFLILQETPSHDSWSCFTFSDSLQSEFSAGEYSISTDTPGPELNITISRAINLILTGPDSPSDQVYINCHRRFRFEFVECDNLTIANMIFNTCGSRSSTSSGALIITTITSLTVANVTVQHSHGYGLMGVRVSGNVTISHCKFFNNSRQRYTENSDNESVSMGGNCLLHLEVATVLIVSESEFTNGIAEELPMQILQSYYDDGDKISGGGGLGVYLEVKRPSYVRSSDITVSIFKSKFINNFADYGGNLLLHTYNRYRYSGNDYTSIFIVNSTFQDGTALLAGGGLHMNLNDNTHHRVYVTRSQFISNSARKGGGVSLKSSSEDYKHDIILSWLLISPNHAEGGGGVYLTHYEWQFIDLV